MSATLTAGRELDALVAERVMGEAMPAALGDDAFQRGLTGAMIPSDGGNWIARWVYNDGDVQEWVPRRFSTDFAAACEVVEEMVRRGYTWRARHLPASDRVHWEFLSGGSAWAQTADDTPLAICKAALAALEDR